MDRPNAERTAPRRLALAGLTAMGLLAFVQLGPAPGIRTAAPAAAPVAKQHALAAYGKLPLAFIPNGGQADARVRYSAQAAGASFWFAQNEAVFALAKKDQGVALRLQFLGADPDVLISGEDPGSGTVNYRIGNDPARWHTSLPTYQEVFYRDLWPGIDLAFRGSAGELKYEFRLAPGARVRDIRLGYQGADGLSVDNGGNLLIRTSLGALEDSLPATYQLIGGTRIPVQSRYVLSENGYGFAVGSYDRRSPLVIDPGLVYSTYLGGTGGEQGLGIAVDGAGSAYVTGITGSADFPTTAGAFDTSFNASRGVAFVTKLNAAGSGLVYSTYLGGSSYDVGIGIAVDNAGSAYVTGLTGSADFPTTAGAFDTSFNGGGDAFVTRLDATGSSLLYSTYLGGTDIDDGRGIAVDAAGNAYVTGETGRSPFPTTAGAFDTTYNGGGLDGFVTKLDAAGHALVYSTYLGGSAGDVGHAIAVDGAGNAYITGDAGSADFPTTAGAFDTSSGGRNDAFVTKLNGTGSGLLYSTYLGGSAVDVGNGIAVDVAGNAYVTGVTPSADFPTTAAAFDTSLNGSYDAFVTRLDAAGSALLYSTYLGGTFFDQGNGIAVDGAGSAFVTGGTGSQDFPTTAGAFDTSLNSGDSFVTKLDAAGSSLLYSTYLGGNSNENGNGIAVAGGSAYVTGVTDSADFPTTAGAFDTTRSSDEAFVSKLDLVPVLTPATLTLSPEADTNQVGTSHTVTATVQDAGGQPVQGVVVRFGVTGSVTASGQCVTDMTGQCSFTYAGPPFAGADNITAYADTNNNNVQNPGEPAGEATKAWVPPASTPGQAGGGGHIEDAAGNLIAFGFSAKSDGGLKGGCTVVDQAADRMIRCQDVTAFVISGNQATIYGNATDNGVPTRYVIKAADNANPGKGADTFSIQTGSGYSRSGVLTAGNIQVG